jgi:hypothetical protein
MEQGIVYQNGAAFANGYQQFDQYYNYGQNQQEF